MILKNLLWIRNSEGREEIWEGEQSCWCREGKEKKKDASKLAFDGFEVASKQPSDAHQPNPEWRKGN